MRKKSVVEIGMFLSMPHSLPYVGGGGFVILLNISAFPCKEIEDSSQWGRYIILPPTTCVWWRGIYNFMEKFMHFLQGILQPSNQCNYIFLFVELSWLNMESQNPTHLSLKGWFIEFINFFFKFNNHQCCV